MVLAIYMYCLPHFVAEDGGSDCKRLAVLDAGMDIQDPWEGNTYSLTAGSGASLGAASPSDTPFLGRPASND